MVGAGYDVRFACVEGSAATVPALARSGFEVLELSNPLDPSELLGRCGAVDIAIFDHYDIGAFYERALRPIAKTVMVIDDLADRIHDCDILVDQTFGRAASDYATLVPTGAKILAGAKYALLRPEFAAVHEWAVARRAASHGIGRILISMGLTDLGGITVRVLDAVLAASTGAAIDVVLGAHATSLDAVRLRAAQRNNVTVHVDTADMCGLMLAADLAIGAAGTTTWERCCLGLPTVTLTLAENQRDVSCFLGASGALSPAGALESVTACVTQLANSHEDWKSMALAAASVTDGQGVRRLLGQIQGAALQWRDTNANLQLTLRKATAADAESLWKWRNDKTSREASGSTVPVTWKQHLQWFGVRLNHHDTLMLVAELASVPIGVVRFDRVSCGSAIVSINLDAAHRSRGLGGSVLREGCEIARVSGFATQLIADVRPSNIASLQIFQRHGFVVTNEGAAMLRLQKALQRTRDEIPPSVGN